MSALLSSWKMLGPRSDAVKTYEIECGGELHEIGLDDEGCLHLLNHDIEEEEASCLLGEGDCSRCFKVLRAVEQLNVEDFCNSIRKEEIEIARLFVDAGFEFDYASGHPLHLAIICCSANVVEFLIECGADVNRHIYTDNGIVPLSHLAVAQYYRDERVIKALEDAGAKWK